MVLNAALAGELVLRPDDDDMHPLGPEPHFNESVYFNFYDAAARVGGWLRLGNRANEGYAERTVCLYLPDGKVAFGFERAPITDNDRLDAGGLRVDTVVPFRELRVRFDGSLTLLGSGMEMEDPKRAFTENPSVAVTADLRFTGISSMYGGEPTVPHELPGEEVARGHTEQLMAAAGTLTVGDERWTIAGHGLRDRSWGPRYWQNVHFHRWMTANFGPDRGFMAVLHVTPSGTSTQRGGFVWEDGQMHLCSELEVTSRYTGPTQVHEALEIELRSGDRTWRATGTVRNLVPCRNRRDGQVTRISEGLTEWRLGDDVGYGLTEYLDQLGSGDPTGVAAGC